MKSRINLNTPDIKVNKNDTLKIQWFQLTANTICNKGKLIILYMKCISN